MTIINYELEKIHRSYKRLDCNVLIPCNCGACKDSQAPDFYRFHTLREWMVCGRQRIQCRKSGDMVEVCGLIDDVIDKDRLQTQEKNRGFVFNAPIGTVVVQQAEEGANVMIKADEKEEIPSKKDEEVASPVKSAWANGLFYLLTCVVVFGGLGVLAGSLPFYTLVLVIVSGMSLLLIVGALQLRQQSRLSEKSFVDLVKFVFRQLPLIRNILGKSDLE